ncbi:MAG: aminopeptidase P family N-terminal domain-containing protein, partial [Alphaproteobacteria bacterium]|nr:aminopeptidase P family N-terminal domain-containing protein [Alphaproteobacteria bacterium]
MATKRKRAGTSSRTTPLALLRAELARRGLDGFMVPHTDEYQNEYLPPHAERLAWLTGFTGSAGLALVLKTRAAVFTDGRYTLQLKAELDTSAFVPLPLMGDQPLNWLAKHIKKSATVGYDPRLHTPEFLVKFEKACARAGASLVACEDNPLDAVWRDQPSPPAARVVPHDLAFAGKNSADKRRELAADLKKQGLGAALLTAPDSIAWLLNIRGGDVDHTPLPLCFAILHADGKVDLFLDPAKGGKALDKHLGAGVTRHAPGELGVALDRLAAAGGRIRLDPARSAAWFFDRITAAGGDIERGTDPCQLPKACKNKVELDGMRAAHLRDGAALVTFLAWLARTAPKGRLGEIAAADKLESMRAGNDRFMDLSFSTISGSGPNGAVVNYRATPKSDRNLKPGDIYLLDSGAQYRDGTTDVTR